MLGDGVATLKFATSEVEPGVRHVGTPDRQVGAGRRRRTARPDRHRRRLRRLVLRLASDLDERRGGQRCLRRRPRHADRARRRAHAIPLERLRVDGTDVVDDSGAFRLPVVDASAGIAIDEPASTTIRPPRSSTRTVRATAIRRSPSSPTTRSSTSTSISGWSRSFKSPPRRTSGGRSTRSRSPARSRAGSLRASASR